MAEILSMISLISFCAAGVSMLLAVIFFIKFKIPSVIGDLSGRNARKSIEQLRETNLKSGNRSYKPSRINPERGKLTETMQGQKKTETSEETTDEGRPETGLLEENPSVAVHSEETVPLTDELSTDMLIDDNETVLLETPDSSREQRSGGVEISILEKIMYVHTDEAIT